MAQILNKYFSAVFTREDVSILPVIETKFEGRELTIIQSCYIFPMRGN